MSASPNPLAVLACELAGIEQAQSLIPQDRHRREVFAAAVQRFREANAAVTELVEADKEYDAACAEWDASAYPRPADRLKAARARRAAALAKFGEG